MRIPPSPISSPLDYQTQNALRQLRSKTPSQNLTQAAPATTAGSRLTGAESAYTAQALGAQVSADGGTFDFTTGPGARTHTGKLPDDQTQYGLEIGSTIITWYGSPGPGKTGDGPGQNAGLPQGQLTGVTISMGADANPTQRAQYLKIAVNGVLRLDGGMSSLFDVIGRPLSGQQN